MTRANGKQVEEQINREVAARDLAANPHLIPMAVNTLCARAYNASKAKGFWDDEGGFTGQALNGAVSRKAYDSMKFALMHSELSEALEALRKGNPPDDHVPELDGISAEMADVCIRIFDYCGRRGIDLGDAIKKKMAYNATRPAKHGKAF